MYEAQADTINVDDIATNSNNRIVMRRIKRNEAKFADDELWIQNQHNDYGEDCTEYVPEGAYDMGWLGYFIGKNEHLEHLYIMPFEPTSGASVRDVIVPFFRGVSRNKSIRRIDFTNTDLLEGKVFTMLTPFFRHNHNLTDINIEECDFGDEGCRLFALAIGSSTNKSLKKVKLENNNITDEGMVDIITALSMYPHLKHLDLDGNHLSKNGCAALATLVRCSATDLQRLFISRTDIGDDGIEALVPALATCSRLRRLLISDNPSITTRGWQRLATILEAPYTDLICLDVGQNNVDDEAVAAFASALTNNHTLQTLSMNNNPSITAVGWEAFSRVLCDMSSINATFLSNHTLQSVGDIASLSNIVMQRFLDLNARDNKKEVVAIKILQCHSDFDMLPFFEWEFKVLPLVLSWLERASSFTMLRGLRQNIERRKLSTIYQFVRGMPLLYVETRLRKELEDIKVAESQLEEEEELQEEEFMQRKQLLQERKENIMKRLGGNSLQKR